MQQNFLNQIIVIPHKAVLSGEVEKKMSSGRRESEPRNVWDPYPLPHFALELWPFAPGALMEHVYPVDQTGWCASRSQAWPLQVLWRSSVTLWPWEVSKLRCLLAKLSSSLKLSFLICKIRIILILTSSSLPRKGNPILSPGPKTVNSGIQRLLMEYWFYSFPCAQHAQSFNSTEGQLSRLSPHQSGSFQESGTIGQHTALLTCLWAITLVTKWTSQHILWVSPAQNIYISCFQCCLLCAA